MTNKELVELLYKEFYNKNTNCIVLENLDFTKYKCNVSIGKMKVSKDLWQCAQDVGGTLSQGHNIVGNDLFQGRNSVGGNLYQRKQQVECNLVQDNNLVGCHLIQGENKIWGNLITTADRIDGEVIQLGDKNETTNKVIPNEQKKLTIEDLKKIIVDNFYDKEKNLITLKSLDFTDLNCSVTIAGLKVKKDLFIGGKEIGGDLFQGCNKVGGDLLQNNNEVKQYLYQSGNKVKRDLLQENNEVAGNIIQGNNLYGKSTLTMADKKISPKK